MGQRDAAPVYCHDAASASRINCTQCGSAWHEPQSRQTSTPSCELGPLQEGARSEQSVAPVWVVERRARHALATRRGVDEDAAALVDSDVPSLAAIQREEHQVTGDQMAARRPVCCGPLVARRARYGDTDAPMGVVHEAAAVEAASAVAAVAVWRADLLDCDADQRRARRSDITVIVATDHGRTDRSIGGTSADQCGGTAGHYQE